MSLLVMIHVTDFVMNAERSSDPFVYINDASASTTADCHPSGWIVWSFKLTLLLLCPCTHGESDNCRGN